ncbi:DUF2802 domain-containing protein [Aliikangiella coralliicola]|uniref:DUF2802 domain-containing protein n=1 Tax=Aliikangiella coralliicola TaxID=2592383 RepID=A0A545TWF1_9GAMM|nr:DUF2802 domain-containing protein [Aliikangiella coralliicola]TQV81548.1 DUF2802 domain-containing protein [Aliikangiella coralliicola]
MNNWPFQITTDISLVSVGLLCAFVVCFIGYLKVQTRYRLLVKEVEQLKNEFRAMNSGHLGMGRELKRVFKEIAQVENNHPGAVQGTSEKVYDQAGLLLSRGATIEEVVQSCDIAPAEAELLAIMRHSAPSHNKQFRESA